MFRTTTLRPAALLCLVLSSALSLTASATDRQVSSGEAVLNLDLLWIATADADGRTDQFQGRDIPVSTEIAVFSTDETLVATTAKGDYSIRVFDARDGRQLWIADGQAETECAAFTQDGRYLVTGGEAAPHHLRVWRVADGTFVRGYTEISSVEGLVFSPDGRMLATGNEGGEVRIYDTSSLDPAQWPDTPLYVLVHGTDKDKTGRAADGHADVNQLNWSADGSFLYSGGRNSLVRKWSLAAIAAGDKDPAMTYAGHQGSVKCVRLSPDGTLVAAGSGWLGSDISARVILWREADGHVLLDHPTSELRVVETVAFDPAQQVLLAAGSETSWNRETAPMFVWRLDDLPSAPGEPHQRLLMYDLEYLCFNRAGDRLLGASADGTVRLWHSTVLPPPPQVDTLKITRVDAPPSGPAVRIAQPLGRRGPTSIRYYPPGPRHFSQSPNPTDPDKGRFAVRDRDLGQTFTTPPGDEFQLDAITLRIGAGPYDRLEATAGARVFLQLMRVSGEPEVNDNGTTAPGLTVSKAYPSRPEADDYLTGEYYESIFVARGGIVPAGLSAGESNTMAPTQESNGSLLRFTLDPATAPTLAPATRYAFLVGFERPGSELSLPFDNWDYVNTPEVDPDLLHTGPYPGGHAIRREGSLEHPYRHPRRAFAFSEHWAAFPAWSQRLRQQPGTWGRPDVDTYRDLVFWIEASPSVGKP